MNRQTVRTRLERLAAPISVAVLAAVSIGAQATVAQEATEEQYIANAAEIVEAVDWGAAKSVALVMTESAFTPKNTTLQVGQPYRFGVFNVSDLDHQLIAEEFFRTVATRTAETAESYVRVPFLTQVEVFAGKNAEVLLVPLVQGTFDLLRETEGIDGASVLGTVTVTGLPPVELADVASGPWLQDGAALVEAADWDARQELTVELSEFAFTPPDFTLAAGQPYEIRVVNVGEVTHEFTAPEFFETVAFGRAEDASASFKAPAPREVEVSAGEATSLYLIPTEAGTFDLVCEIPGHFEAGMFGTISVTVAP